MSSSMSSSTTTLHENNTDLPSTTCRQRQSKKDEAIRKKIEQELSKKRNTGTRVRQTKKITGTVSALRPSQALTMKESILVIEAAQLMAAKRSDCVLIVDEEEHLSGILTARDMAYRVLANYLDPRSTSVSEIMTRRPMCVMADTSAQDALNLMVSRRFRHLPVCNEEGDIFGLLDITKCLYEALKKMERAYESSRKLYDALEGVEREWAKNSPAQFVQYMNTLREKMECPDLSTLLDQDNNNNHAVVQVSVKAHVRGVAKLMKEYRTTAVLVMDHGGLAGIFTTKDIVLRVIAAGLVPDNCSVIRVMTPHPDTATTSTSILEALKKMHDGHYLNLPVLDEDRNICGLVDVLRLTHATLKQISSIEGNNNNNHHHNNSNTTCSGNPMTNNNKFWDNIIMGNHHNNGGADLHDSDSVVSDSSRMLDSPTTPQPDDQQQRAVTLIGVNHSQFYGTTASSEDDDQRSVFSVQNNNTFSFKFSDGARTYRFRCHFSLSALRHAIKIRIKTTNNNIMPKREQGWEDFTLAYLDDEQDQVLLTCDADILDAVTLARKMGHDRVKLLIVENSNLPITISTVTEQHCSPIIHRTSPSPSVSSTLAPSTITNLHHHHDTLTQASEEEEEIISILPTTTTSSSYHLSDSDEEAILSSSSSAIEEDGSYYYQRQRRRSSCWRAGGVYNKRRYNDTDELREEEQEALLPAAAMTFLGAVIISVFTLGR